MNFIKVKDEKELGKTAARLVCESISEKKTSTLVFPTGNTPLGMFTELVSLYQSGKVSFRNSRLIELDEYYGIKKDDDRNLFAWLERELLRQVDFLPENIHRFNSDAADPLSEARRMAEVVNECGGIDLLVLGLGMNGHLGFNEPGAKMDSPTRLVELTPESLISSANYWAAGAEIPGQGFTLGMDLLLKARKTILLVQGASKAQILNQSLNGIMTDQVPATYLRLAGDLTVIADREATLLPRNQD